MPTQNVLGYYVFSSTCKKWLGEEGRLVSEISKAREFPTEQEANEEMARSPGCDYVFACMGSP